MSYRPSRNPPETAWARHLDKVMRERDWSRVQMFEDIGAALGYKGKSRSAFLGILTDRDPTPERAKILGERYGWPEVEAEPEPQLDLASAIVRLVDELTAMRVERTALAAEVERLGEVVDGLVGRAIRDEATPTSQPEKAG